VTTAPSLGVVEGYYGPPLSAADRAWFVQAIGGLGFTSFTCAPKDDPFHRARWREPYPDEELAAFADLVEVGRAAGVAVGFGLSPGLDLGGEEDDRALAEKLRRFADLGATDLAVAFDDVPPGGADLGARHARAVARAVAENDAGVRWVVCPTDYATAVVTPYLRAFVDGLPEGVDVLWTGPSIVSIDVPGDLAGRLGEELGRPLTFAENFPVSDGPMADVLHLGPYPRRDPALVGAVTGVVCNIAPRPRSSLIGLACAALWWTDPTGDRDEQWRSVVDGVPGLAPLARACRTWAADPGPDASLVGAVDAALADPSRAVGGPLWTEVHGSCRDGLDPDLAAEVAPWLDQWDAEAVTMAFALDLLADDEVAAWKAFTVVELWMRARAGAPVVFGPRWASYPVTSRAPDGTGPELFDPRALLEDHNLTDRLCRAALRLPR
jgi:hypothetical protein